MFADLIVFAFFIGIWLILLQSLQKAIQTEKNKENCLILEKISTLEKLKEKNLELFEELEKNSSKISELEKNLELQDKEIKLKVELYMQCEKTKPVDVKKASEEPFLEWLKLLRKKVQI